MAKGTGNNGRAGPTDSMSQHEIERGYGLYKSGLSHGLPLPEPGFDRGWAEKELTKAIGPARGMSESLKDRIKEVARRAQVRRAVFSRLGQPTRGIVTRSAVIAIANRILKTNAGY